MGTYNAYPPEVHEFVKEHCKKLRDRDLAKACNEALGTHFTTNGMKAFRSNHKYRSGYKKYTLEEYWKYQTYYPQGLYEYVRDNSWGVSSEEMAKRCNEKFGTHFTKGAMKQFRTKFGIKSGVTGWFQKENPPGTKGKTLEEICKGDPEKLARIRATQFKKGQKPANELPVGTVVVSSDGYKLRKKQMEGTMWERWEMLHRAVWAEHHGPIPEGMLVGFKDGNTLNCDISNLMLMTKSENAQVRPLRSEDPDITDAALAMVRLKNAVKERRKDAKGKNKSNRKETV